MMFDMEIPVCVRTPTAELRGSCLASGYLLKPKSRRYKKTIDATAQSRWGRCVGASGVGLDGPLTTPPGLMEASESESEAAASQVSTRSNPCLRSPSSPALYHLALQAPPPPDGHGICVRPGCDNSQPKSCPLPKCPHASHPHLVCSVGCSARVLKNWAKLEGEVASFFFWSPSDGDLALVPHVCMKCKKLAAQHAARPNQGMMHTRMMHTRMMHSMQSPTTD